MIKNQQLQRAHLYKTLKPQQRIQQRLMLYLILNRKQMMLPHIGQPRWNHLQRLSNQESALWVYYTLGIQGIGPSRLSHTSYLALRSRPIRDM